MPASSLATPRAIAAQNTCRCSRRATGGRPGDRIAGLPVAAAAQPGLVHPPIHLLIQVLRRPVESTQYTSAEFANMFCADQRLSTSVGRTGVCWITPQPSCFFATLKNEMYYRQRFDTRAKARFAVAEYIEIFYNRKRLHFSLGLPHPRRNPRRPPGPRRGLTTTTTRNCPRSLTQPSLSRIGNVVLRPCLSAGAPAPP